MKLIWTYNSKTIINELTDYSNTIILNYYIQSIIEANRIGYYTIIYCDSNSIKYFEKYVKELIIVDEYENSLLFDSYKFKVMEDDFNVSEFFSHNPICCWIHTHP
jgi:hypothetical protein